MSNLQFSRCELRLPENPFHSALRQPWGMVAIGGLFANLHEAKCSQCRGICLVRHYLTHSCALLWPDTPDQERRSELISSGSVSLAMQTLSCPALVHSGPHRLVDIQVSLPDWSKDFFDRASKVISIPFGVQKSRMTDNGYRVLRNFCPECNSDLRGESKFPSTTLVVTDVAGEQIMAPVPMVARIAD